MNQHDYWTQRWAQALRSGRYRQTWMTRQNDDGHCAVSVLYEEARQDGIGVYEVAAMVGLDAHATAVYLNDTERRSFSEIADWLERDLPSVTVPPVVVRELAPA